LTTRTIAVEDFGKEMEAALRAVLPTHVEDMRVTPKNVYVFLGEREGETRTRRSFGVDNGGHWTLRLIEQSLTCRTVTETGRVRAYSSASREGLARKVADWFSQGFAEVVSQ